MKKILFITTNEWVPWGGSEVLWSETAKTLVGQQYEIFVSIRKWHPTPKHIVELKALGCQIYEKEKPKVILPFYQRLANRVLPKAKQYTYSYNPYEILDQRKYDLVVFSLGDHNEVSPWMRECRARNYPYAIIVQLVKDAVWHPDGSYADEIYEGYTRAKHCFFVSKNNLELVEKQLATHLKNATVVYNPFQVNYHKPFVFPKLDNEPVYKLACVASLSTAHKGQDILFEVLSQEKWRKRPIQVRLYGKGPHQEQLKKLRDFWKLDNVEFIGFATDIDNIWEENHALIMCSRMEGLPLALVEAMLCGRVPIVTDIGGNKEVVDDNICGFIAKAPTVEFIDEALERAWSRRNEWNQIGAAAYEKVRKFIPSDPVAYFAKKIEELL